MGIGQLLKKREEPQEEENLKEIFENIKSQEIPHKTGKKVINFIYVSKCGCGSTSEGSYHAIVPEDYEDVKDGYISPKYKDGKTINGTKYYINKNYEIKEGKREFIKKKVLYTSYCAIEETSDNIFLDNTDEKNYIVNFI